MTGHASKDAPVREVTVYRPGPTGSDQVAYAVQDGIGHVLLNRPRALNTLTPEMIEDLLAQVTEWLDAGTVSAISLRGAGERGLCAGGDVKAVRAALLADDPDTAIAFWAREYELDLLLATSPVPVVSRMSGFVMGGGLGVSAFSAHRCLAADSQLAMPETVIGFFPDVGITRLLARAPGELGTYVALTGATFGPADAIALGLADRIDTDESYDRVIDAVAQGADLPAGMAIPASPLAGARGWIDECFAGDDASAIVRRLTEHPDDDARECAQLLRARSPLAVCVTLARIRAAAAEPDLATTLAVDRTVAAGMMRHPDFAEGVRARLVDKDNAPRWAHPRIEDVDPAEVAALFASP